MLASNTLRSVALFLFCFLILITTNAHPRETGISKTSITCGSYAPLTGPISSYGRNSVFATAAFFDYINSNGGVHGRKIIYKLQDDQNIASRSVLAVKKLVQKESVFAIVGGYGTHAGLEVVPYVMQNQIPFIAPISLSYRFAYKKPSEYLSRYIFSLFTNNATQAKLLINYATQILRGKKFGIVYPENTFGREGLDSLVWALKKNKLKPLAVVSHKPGNADFSSTILKLKNSGCEHVVLWESPFYVSDIVKAAEKIKWMPIWLGNSLLADPVVAKIAPKGWNNAVVASLFPLVTSDDPGTRKFAKIVERKNLPINIFTQAGFAAGELFVEGLRKAGPNLCKENFILAMESIRDWNGLILHNISFSPKIRQGMTSVFFARFTEGKYHRISNWVTIPGDENGPPPP